MGNTKNIFCMVPYLDFFWGNESIIMEVGLECTICICRMDCILLLVCCWMKEFLNY